MRHRFFKVFGSKTISKMEPISIKSGFQNAISFWNRFLVDLHLSTHAPDLQTVCCSYIAEIAVFDFDYLFYSKKLQKKIQKPSQIQTNAFRNLTWKLIQFCIDFRRFWLPKWTPKPRMLFTFEPPGPSFGSTSAQNGPEICHRPYFGCLFNDIWRILV